MNKRTHTQTHVKAFMHLHILCFFHTAYAQQDNEDYSRKKHILYDLVGL